MYIIFNWGQIEKEKKGKVMM